MKKTYVKPELGILKNSLFEDVYASLSHKAAVGTPIYSTPAQAENGNCTPACGKS